MDQPLRRKGRKAWRRWWFGSVALFWGSMTDKNGVNVRLSAIAHQGERRIALHFPYDPVLIAAAKSAGAKWSATLKCWHVPNGREHITALFSAFKGKAWVDGGELFGRTTKSTPAV